MFLGWWMTLLSGMTTGLGHAFCLRGFSALFKPISADLGFSRAVTSGADGIRRLQFGFMAPFIGWLCDRFGPRWIMMAGICFLVVGLVLMNFVNSLLAYYVVWGVIIGMGNGLGLTIAPDKALTEWFVAKRGRAFSIRFVLVSMVSAAFLPLITWMINTYGWRNSSLVWSIVMGVTLPFVWLTIKEKRPEYYGLLPDGLPSTKPEATESVQILEEGLAYAANFQESEFSLPQAMKTQAYWILILADASGMVVYAGFGLHCIPLITDLGIAPTVAGSLMSMMILFTIPSNFLGGLIADRTRKERLKFILGAAYLCQAFGIAAFLLNPSTLTLYILLILFGFGSGPVRALLILIRARFFGRKAYGSIEGTSLTFGTPFSILSPIYAGAIFDKTGSYYSAFAVFAAMAAFAAFILCLIRHPNAAFRLSRLH
jgi:cyanate permease